ncbi:MAG: sigma-70 family RNA polymerase sigma factor [Candidatus Brocadiae bacterium]|nr:sigma-70 family RNA polymerase sigma factor [Candidatus Brocadiia bacterium]
MKESYSFPETHWSVLLNRDTKDRQKCLEELASKYWKPVYRVAILAGCNKEQAEDFTQELFLTLLRQPQILDKIDPSKGRFRTYLIKILKNIQKDDYKRKHAQKRIHDKEMLSLNFSGREEEGFFIQDNKIGESLFEEKWQAMFNSTWLQTLRGISLDQIAQSLAQDKQKEIKIAILKKSLFENKKNIEIMEELSLDKDFVCRQIKKMQEIYLFYLQQNIAETVSSEEYLEIEVSELMALL